MRQVTSDRSDVLELWEATNDEFRAWRDRIHAYTIGAPTETKRVDAALALGDMAIFDPPSSTLLRAFLPSAAKAKGMPVTIKHGSGSSGTVAMIPVEGELIDGSSSPTALTSYQFRVLVSNGRDWFIVGQN